MAIPERGQQMVWPVTVEMEGGVGEGNRRFVHEVREEDGVGQVAVGSDDLKNLHGMEVRQVVEDAFEHPHGVPCRNKPTLLEFLDPVPFPEVSCHSDQGLGYHHDLLVFGRCHHFLEEGSLDLQELREVHFEYNAFLEATEAVSSRIHACGSDGFKH